MKRLRFIVIALFWGCAHPSPPPSLNPMLPPGITEPDIFTDYVADCSEPSVEAQSVKATQFVRGCFDFDGGYDGCLVQVANHFSKDTIVCVAIELNVGWQREIAKETASEIQRANAKHANDWIRRHRIGARQ